MPEVAYWSCRDDIERLPPCTSRDEAVEWHIDDCDWVAPTLTLYGFARMEPDLGIDQSLEPLLECLDEEHGDPDGDSTEPTERMKAAEAEFHKVVLEEYESWACEVVTTEKVDTLAWLKENKPDWVAEVDIRDGVEALG